MKKFITTSGLALALIGTGFAMPAAAQSFDAGDSERPTFEQRGERGQAQRRARKNLGDDVTKTVSKIDNGIILTLTTEDADLLTKIQARENKKERENVTTSKVNIANGVQLTITSDDAETVAKMHERADRSVNKQNTTKVVENLDNGVQITVTGSTPEAIAAILEREEKLGHNNDEVIRTRLELSNGVQTTITSENPDLVTRIQARAERGHPGKRGGKRNHDRRGDDQAPEAGQ